MGPARYARYLKTADAVHAGEQPLAALYESVASLEEANLLMSHQAAPMEAAFAALERSARPRFVAGARVGDLGTYTGALASFLALRYPQVAVTGVDRVARLVSLAATRDRGISNLRYEHLDYAEPTEARSAFDVLLSSFGIDFPVTDRVHGLTVENLRQGSACEETLGIARSVLRTWRSLAAPGAICRAVLRLSTAESVVAVVDAAREEGWAWQRRRSRHVRVGDESFTLLAWAATEALAPKPREDSILAFVGETSGPRIRRAMAAGGLREFAGAEAILAFRALASRNVEREESRRFDDGHVMRKQLGSAEQGLYVLTRADNSYTHLVVGRSGQHADLAERFEQEFWEGVERA